MFYAVREQTLQLRTMQIDSIAFGTGKKPLLIIQGLNTRGIKGTGVFLAWMYRRFAKDYRVYLFERRPDVGEDITVQDMAADIAQAMDVLHLTRADVLGVSQGGMIAQYLTIDRPDLVNKLALAVTLSRNNDTVRAVIGRWITLVEQQNMKELVADMAVNMYSDSYVRRYRPFLPLLAIFQKPGDTGRFIRLARACLTCDTYDRLEEIRCPVLVIGGGKDKVLTGEASREIARRLGCPIHMYDDLGHAAYEEAADFQQRVYDFFMA